MALTVACAPPPPSEEVSLDPPMAPYPADVIDPVEGRLQCPPGGGIDGVVLVFDEAWDWPAGGYEISIRASRGWVRPGVVEDLPVDISCLIEVEETASRGDYSITYERWDDGRSGGGSSKVFVDATDAICTYPLGWVLRPAVVGGFRLGGSLPTIMDVTVAGTTNEIRREARVVPEVRWTEKGIRGCGFVGFGMAFLGPRPAGVEW